MTQQAGKKLPHRDKAYIPETKLRMYLLSETHAVGRTKARFFRGVGFNEANVELLEKGFLEIAQNEPVTEEVFSQFGTKYIIEGDLQSPEGRRLRVRTVWVVEQDETAPRFVTAYPA